MSKKTSCELSILKDNPKIKKTELRQMLDAVDELSTQTDSLDEFNMASGKMLADLRRSSTEARVQRIENEIKIRTISKIWEDPKTRQFIANNPDKGLASVFVKTEESFKGAGNSIELEEGTIRGQLLSMLNQALAPEDWKILGRDSHTLEIMQYIVDGRTDVSAKAKELGDVINKLDNEAFKHRKLSGSLVKQKKGWGMKQTHDPSLMTAKGKDAWVESVLTKTGKNPIKREVLEDIYDDIILNRYERSLQKEKMEAGSSITGNLNKNKSRQIIFDDAKAMVDYHKEFGQGTLLDNIMSNVDASAREAAVFNRLGTNPLDAYNRLSAEVTRIARTEGEAAIQKAIKDGVPEEAILKKRSKLAKKLDKLNNKKATLNEIVDKTVFGAQHGNSLVAKIGHTSRTVLGLAKLGKVVLTGGLPDNATSAAALSAATGMTKADALKRVIVQAGKNLSPKRVKKLGRAMGIYYGAASGHVQSRFTTGEAGTGAMAALSDTFYKYSGLTKQTEMYQTGNMYLVAQDYGEVANLSFKDLSPHKQAELNRININEYDWDQLRKGTGKIEGEPDDIIAISFMEDKGIKSPIEGISDAKYLRDLQVKWNSMGRDVSLGGSPTGGLKEDIMFTGGTDPNTIRGQVLRMAAQFKKVAFASQGTVKREALSGERAVGKTFLEAATTKGVRGTVIANTAGTVSLMTLFGYMTESAAALEKGITPPDPTNPETWVASVLRGGSAGVMGDFLAGEYNKRYKNLAADILGPTVSTASDVAEVFAGAVRGDDVSSKAARKLLNNVPFGNMIGIRTALDALILNDLMGTEYMNRKKKSLEERGQEYLLGD